MPLRVTVAGNGFFAHRRAPRSRRVISTRHLLRPRQQHLVRRDLDVVEAGATKLVARPLGELAIARRSGEVWLIGEEAMGVANAIGGGKREEATLELPLAPALASAKP